MSTGAAWSLNVVGAHSLLTHIHGAKPPICTKYWGYNQDRTSTPPSVTRIATCTRTREGQ
eukprot:423468-Pyramimonas_sp.AAC.1